MKLFIYNIIFRILGGTFITLAITIFILMIANIESMDKKLKRSDYKHILFIFGIGISLTLAITIIGYIIPELNKLYGGL